jgi:hypothetical protein
MEEISIDLQIQYLSDTGRSVLHSSYFDDNDEYIEIIDPDFLSWLLRKVAICGQ